MSKKIRHIVVPMLILVMLIIGMTLSVQAFTIAQTDTIDNDDAQGYSNDREGFNEKFTGSNLFYQDARIQECTESYYYYGYNLKTAYTRHTDIYGTVSAFLYHKRFTDPEANYLIGTCSSSMYCSAGYINQNLAPAGWNEIGTAVNSLLFAPDIRSTDDVRVQPSGNHPGFYCGADAIKIELGY